MPDINFALYLNIVFAAMIGFGMLFGLIKGMKKSLYALISKLIYYVFFFATIGVMVNVIWTAPLPYIGEAFGAFDGALSNVRTLDEGIPPLLESLFGDQLDQTLENEEFMAFVVAIGMFVVKLAYTLFYFTVFKIIWNVFSMIVYLIFIRNRKEDKFRNKHRLAGAGIGALSGVLSIYIFLILFGGVMNISTNLVSLLDETTESDAVELAQTNNDNVLPEETQEEIEFLRNAVDAYNNNPFVSLMSHVTVTNEETGRERELTMVLFDSVFSIDYRETHIALREEIAIFTDIAGVFLNSDYAQTENIADISPDEVRRMFNTLAASELFVVILPVAIEVGADYFDTEINLDREALYAIDWRLEVAQLGEIMATTLVILTDAGVFDESVDYETHVFDGEDFRSLFNHISESNIITLAAYTAFEPLLNQLSDDMQAVLTVPEGVVWEDEFKAFGEIVGSIVDTDITLGELQDQDYNVILTKFASLDLKVILESKLITQSMINALNGALENETLDNILVPDDVVWLDDFAYDDETIAQEDKGELRLILEGLNAISKKASEIDFEDVDLMLMITAFDRELVETVLNSRVIETSLGAFLYDMSLEEEILQVPKSVLIDVMVKQNPRTVIIKDELFNMVDTVQMLNIEDFEQGFDASIFEGLDENNIPNLFDSKILHATLSKLMIDLTDEEDPFIVIPPYDESASTVIVYYDETDEVDYIAVSELTNIITAFLSLDITEDFADLNAMDLSKILDNINVLLDSSILHASVSNQVFKIGTDTIVVPYYHETGAPLRITVTLDDATAEYIQRSELEYALEALDKLGVLDIDGFDGQFGLDMLSDPDTLNAILNSSILQATISDILLDMSVDNNSFLVPYYLNDETEDLELRISVGSQETATEYILKSELNNLIDALVALGLTDNLDTFTGAVDLTILEDTEKRTTILSSSIIQATLSEQLFTLEASDTIVILPHNINTVGSGGEATTYVIESELNDFVDAVMVLGLNDVQSYAGDFDMQMLSDEANQDTLLNSNIMHATISSLMDDLDDTVLLIPDHVLDGDDLIEKVEIKALIDGFIIFDFNNVGAAAPLSPTMITESDIDVLMRSASIQVTISDLILQTAQDESDTTSTSTLIVPSDLRDMVNVKGVPYQSIEETELEHLLIALITLDFTDFSDGVDATGVTNLAEDMDTLLESISVHLTINNMLSENANIDVPDLAYIPGSYYGITDVITSTEISSFVKAAQRVGTSFTAASFDLNTIETMDETDQAVILDSMIVRNTLTEQIYVAMGMNPTDPLFPIDETYYEEDDYDNFLTKAGIEYYFDQIS